MEVGYEVVYVDQVVRTDIPKLSSSVNERIKRAIEAKLTTHPETYGKPLRRSLKGYRKLRVGEYRVVFRIDKGVVKVFTIGHRRDVYTTATKRPAS
jgi:mRNA interferase RelE/StbE